MKTETQRLFDLSMKRLPGCIGGYDSFAHKTAADLWWLVQLQVDLWDEGEDSEITTKKEYLQCKKYMADLKKRGALDSLCEDCGKRVGHINVVFWEANREKLVCDLCMKTNHDRGGHAVNE